MHMGGGVVCWGAPLCEVRRPKRVHVHVSSGRGGGPSSWGCVGYMGRRGGFRSVNYLYEEMGGDACVRNPLAKRVSPL